MTGTILDKHLRSSTESVEWETWQVFTHCSDMSQCLKQALFGNDGFGTSKTIIPKTNAR